MTDVIKLNGQKERFSEEKVKNSIEGAIRDAGLDLSEKQKLIDKTLNDVNELVGNKKEITAVEIRRVIINDFEEEWVGDQIPVAAAWRNYELKHGIIYKE